MTEEVKRINLDIEQTDGNLSDAVQATTSSRISKISQGFTEGEDSDEEKYDLDGKRTPQKIRPMAQPENLSRRSSVEICDGFRADPLKSPSPDRKARNTGFQAENILNEFEKQLNQQSAEMNLLEKPQAFSIPAANPESNGSPESPQSNYIIVKSTVNGQQNPKESTVASYNQNQGFRRPGQNPIQSNLPTFQESHSMEFQQMPSLQATNFLNIQGKVNPQRPLQGSQTLNVLHGANMISSTIESKDYSNQNLGFDSFKKSPEQSPAKSQNSIEIDLGYGQIALKDHENIKISQTFMKEDNKKIEAIQLQIQKITQLSSTQVSPKEIKIALDKKSSKKSNPTYLSKVAKKPPSYKKRSSSQKVIDSQPTVTLPQEAQSEEAESFSSFSPKPKRKIYREKVNIQKISPLDQELSPMSKSGEGNSFLEVPMSKEHIQTTNKSKNQGKNMPNEQTELIKQLMSQIEKLSEKLEQRTSSPAHKKPSSSTEVSQKQEVSTKDGQSHFLEDDEYKYQREESARKLKRGRAKTNRIDYFGNKINHLLNKVDQLYAIKSPRSILSRSSSPITQRNLERSNSPAYKRKQSEPSNVSQFNKSHIDPRFKETSHSDHIMTPHTMKNYLDQVTYTLSSVDDDDYGKSKQNRNLMSGLLRQSQLKQEITGIVQNSQINSQNWPDSKPGFTRGNSRNIQYYGQGQEMNHFPAKRKTPENYYMDDRMLPNYQLVENKRKIHPNFLNIPTEMRYSAESRKNQTIEDTGTVSSEFDHNFPSSRDPQRSKEIMETIPSIEMKSSNCQVQNNHASFGAHPISTPRNRVPNADNSESILREQSSQCPPHEFSNLRAGLRQYLPNENDEITEDTFKFSKISNDLSQKAHIMIQDHDRYLDFDTFDSNTASQNTGRDSSRIIPKESELTGRSSPGSVSQEVLQEKNFNPLRVIRLMVSCHKNLVHTKSSFKKKKKKFSDKILTKWISAYIENLTSFKHDYFPIYYGLTDILSKLNHKDSKMLFSNYDPLYQSFYQVDNNTIYSVHLDLKKELESTENKLEKSLDLITHGEMFDKKSRQDFYNSVSNIMNKSVSQFATCLKTKIRDYLKILSNSIGLSKNFDSKRNNSNFESSPESNSFLFLNAKVSPDDGLKQQSYESWGLGNMNIQLTSFEESPIKEENNLTESAKFLNQEEPTFSDNTSRNPPSTNRQLLTKRTYNRDSSQSPGQSSARNTLRNHVPEFIQFRQDPASSIRMTQDHRRKGSSSRRMTQEAESQMNNMNTLSKSNNKNQCFNPEFQRKTEALSETALFEKKASLTQQTLPTLSINPKPMPHDATSASIRNLSNNTSISYSPLSPMRNDNVASQQSQPQNQIQKMQSMITIKPQQSKSQNIQPPRVPIEQPERSKSPSFQPLVKNQPSQSHIQNIQPVEKKVAQEIQQPIVANRTQNVEQRRSNIEPVMTQSNTIPGNGQIDPKTGNKILSTKITYNPISPEDYARLSQAQHSPPEQSSPTKIIIRHGSPEHKQFLQRQNQANQKTQQNSFMKVPDSFVNLKPTQPRDTTFDNPYPPSPPQRDYIAQGQPGQQNKFVSPLRLSESNVGRFKYNDPIDSTTSRSGPQPNIPVSYSSRERKITAGNGREVSTPLGKPKQKVYLSPAERGQHPQTLLQKTIPKRLVSNQVPFNEFMGTKLNMNPEDNRNIQHNKLREIKDTPSRPYPITPPESYRWADQRPVRETELVSRIIPGRQNLQSLENYQYKEPSKFGHKNFGAQDITDIHSGKNTRTTPGGRIVFGLRKAEGTITTIKRIGSTKNSGKVAIGFTSGDLLFTDLNQCFKPEFNGVSLKEECYKVHTSSINSMEVSMINFKKSSSSKSKEVDPRKILLTGGSESECSIIVWDLDDRKALKRLSGHKHQISCIVDLKDFSHVASASFDGRVAIWDISKNFACKKLLECHSSPILNLHYNFSMDQLIAGYMDGTINVWSTQFNQPQSDNAANHSSRVRIKHIMEMTMTSHILKLELIKAEPYDMLLILGSDFQITCFALTPKKPRKVAILGSKYPLVDFKVIQTKQNLSTKYKKGFRAHDISHKYPTLNMGGFRLLAIDNRTNIIEYGMLKPGNSDKPPKYGIVHQIRSGQSYKSEVLDNKKVEIEQFFGSNPKTELFLRHYQFGKSVLMKDQKAKALIIQKIHQFINQQGVFRALTK